MLRHLVIRDIVLIEQLDLACLQGLSVLTGETGAGKSILLDAFALALGGRGDGSLVRAGARQGQVTALFELADGHPAREIAAAQGLVVEGDLILRRVQMADGRSRAYINDQPVSGAAMRALSESLVEIHGQHDERALVEPDHHRSLLDAYGGLEAAAADVAAVYRAMRGADAAVIAETTRLEGLRRERDYYEHARDELDALSPQRGEEAALAEARQRMMQAEKVVADIAEAHDALTGHGSPVAMLAALTRRLERRGVQAPELIAAPVAAMEAVLQAFDEAQARLEDSLRLAEFDPHELESTEARLFGLRGAARKYNVSCDQLPATAASFIEALDQIDAGEASLRDLKARHHALAQDYALQAQRLSERRAAAATGLDNAVNAELPPLKLERASFMTQVASTPEAGGEHGYDRVEFWVSTNPGTKPGPLMKIASGGELSRFMLALKVALAERGSAPTLVFDEIDSGAGGAVADAIGQRLASLAGKVQVLAVTHAPQVAARARQHWRISKSEVADGARVETRVALLDAEGRREEIARMLAGSRITEEARAAATRLLEGALNLE